MEAWRFGFDLPPAYKFDPTDADIVAHYLLPRATGIRDPPYAHAVIDGADPCSCPPWELLRRHGHAGSDQAFFVGPGPTPTGAGPSSSLNGGGGRASRVVGGSGAPGGVWRGQKGEEADLVVSRAGGGGAEIRLRFKRYNLTYYVAGERAASGWVMHEYHILKPKLRPGAVLWRVRITERAKKERKKKKKQAAAAAKKAAPPGQDRAGPSHCRAAGNAAAAAVKKDDRGPDRAAGSAASVASDGGEGTSGGTESDFVHQGDDGDNGGGGYFTDLLNSGEGGDGYYADDSNDYFNADQPGPSVYGRAAGNDAAPNDGCAGTFGAQPDAVGDGNGGGGGGVVGGTAGGYCTNFFDAGERHGCYGDDANSYFNQGGGSGGDIFFAGEDSVLNNGIQSKKFLGIQ